MVLRGVGACLIARLMRADRDEAVETDWLLYGPTDPEVVEPEREEAQPLLLAAE